MVGRWAEEGVFFFLWSPRHWFEDVLFQSSHVRFPKGSRKPSGIMAKMQIFSSIDGCGPPDFFRAGEGSPESSLLQRSE